MSAREEDYKAVGAAAGLAYNQKVGAESAVDINLAKQLNVVMTQLGVSADSIVMNVGSAAVGYGYEYVVSTLDRIKAAALSQDDKMLQMPIITPIASETWNVKEAMATEEESPEWGNQEVRGVSMEIQTAAASIKEMKTTRRTLRKELELAQAKEAEEKQAEEIKELTELMKEKGVTVEYLKSLMQ